MASPGETRYVDPNTGGMKGQKEARFGGADPLFLNELAKVYGMGEVKYERYNYLKGYPWSLSIDALFRHLFAFLGGEDVDPESGLLHTAHVAWHAGTLTSFALRDIGTDDRAPRPGQEVPLASGVAEATVAVGDWESLKALAWMEAQLRAAYERCDHGILLADHCELCCSMCADEGR